MKLTNEMKNTLNGINDSSDVTGENISELEGIPKETIQRKKQRKKKKNSKKGKGWHH